MSNEQISELYQSLSGLDQLKNWNLTYASNVDGCSYTLFSRKTKKIGPNILVV